VRERPKRGGRENRYIWREKERERQTGDLAPFAVAILGHCPSGCAASHLRVQDLGFRVQGAGFRVQGSGCGVQGSGLRVWGSGFRV